MTIRAMLILGVFLLLICWDSSPQLAAERNSGEVVVDSDLSLDEATRGTAIPERILKSLVLIDVLYFGFDQKIHLGQLVVHRDVASDLLDIFNQLFEQRFPIEKVKPIVLYQWSDSLSMADNNTSAFNYRKATSSMRLSKHALGKAIDINPALNPYIRGNLTLPPGSRYNPEKKGTITGTSVVVRLFEKRRWKWGGRWRSLKDYQHFEKP